MEGQLSQARDAISQEQERRKEMEKEMIKLKVELAVIKERSSGLKEQFQ